MCVILKPPLTALINHFVDLWGATYNNGSDLHPTADSDILNLLSGVCGRSCLASVLSGLFWLVGEPAPSFCFIQPWRRPSDTEEEAENREKEQTAEGEEMIKGEMAGSGSCTDRKQRLFLSSYPGWIQPWGLDQRGAPCFHLLQWALVCIGSFTEIVFVFPFVCAQRSYTCCYLRKVWRGNKFILLLKK